MPTGLAPLRAIHAEKYPITPLPAGGLLAAVNGLQVGVVTALEGDPAGEAALLRAHPATASTRTPTTNSRDVS